MSLNFKPLLDKVVILEDKVAETTAGGIYLPTQVQEKPTIGTVMAVGPGRTFSNGTKEVIDVVPGDRVMFHKQAGCVYKIDGVDYKMMCAADIIGVVKDE